LFAPAALLGLLDTDNLNALDIRRDPEPATLLLLLIGLVLLEIRNRKTRLM